MDTVLTDNIWKQVATRTKQAKRRLAAVAYMTSDRYLKLVQNDVLICDASDPAIKTGQTSAKLIRSLLAKGVEVRSHSNLHAKAAVFGGFALVGSSNLSVSSEEELTELALLTDRGQVVAQVTAFVHGLRESSEIIDKAFLQRILKLKVDARKRGSQRKANTNKFGNRTWLVSVKELADDRFPNEQAFVDSATEKASTLVADNDSTISWIRWTGNSRFRTFARKGDRVIQISTSLSGKRTSVIAPSAIILRQDRGNWTRFYIAESGDCKQLSWTKYKAAAGKQGLSRISKNSVRELNPREVLELDMLLA